MENQNIIYINRSGKASKFEAQLVFTEEGYEIISTDGNKLDEDISFYSNIREVKTIFPLSDFLFFVGMVIVALYFILNPSLTGTNYNWMVWVLGAFSLYTLGDFIYNFIKCKKSVAIYYKNGIRVDMLFVTKEIAFEVASHFKSKIV